MSNPIIEHCERAAAGGLHPSAVCIEMDAPRGLLVRVEYWDRVPLGEASDIGAADIPPGITMGGAEKMPADVLRLLGNAEQAEAIIRELAIVGEAHDWARVDGDTPDYPHYWTKPNKWLRPADREMLAKVRAKNKKEKR